MLHPWLPIVLILAAMTLIVLAVGDARRRQRRGEKGWPLSLKLGVASVTLLMISQVLTLI